MSGFNILALQILSYITGVFIGGTTLMAQIAENALSSGSAGWFPLLVQAGMTAVVAILLLRNFPSLMKAHQEQTDKFISALAEQRREHTELMNRVAAQHNATVAEAHELLRQRGYCPVRDGEIQHHNP